MMGFFILTAAFFGFFGYSMWSSKIDVHGVFEKTGHVIYFIFLGLFTLFSLGCLYMVLGFKICYLTQGELSICRPLFLSKRTISLSDIEGLSAEEEEKIDISRGFDRNIISIGHSTKIRLKNGKLIDISSLEIWDYNTLIKKLRTELRNKKH